MRLYICVLDEVPDYITPTLVAHSVLLAHEKFKDECDYMHWHKNSFKKCDISCIVVCPCHSDILFAKLWKPRKE